MDHRKSLLKELAFFGCLFAVLVLTAGGHIVVGDEETMVRLTQSLLSGRGLAVSSEMLEIPGQEYAGFLPTETEFLPTTSAVPGRHGQTYSKYGFGQSFAVIPLYYLGAFYAHLVTPDAVAQSARWAVSMFNALALAGCAWLMVSFWRALGYHDRTARWLAVGMIFTSMAWPYVKTFYPQPAVSFLILLIVYSAYQWRSRGESRWPWWMSFSMACLILFRVSEVIILPVVVIYLSLSTPQDRRWKWVLPLCLGVVVGIAATLGYNWLRFGAWFSTGYNEVAWTTPFWLGLYGLLFSTGKGIFVYCPLLILGIVGWLVFSRRHRAEAWLIAGIWVSFLLFYAPYKYWTGGFNWGPRFLLPLVPLGYLTLGALLEGGRPRLAWVAFGLLFALGLVIQFPAILVDHSRYLYLQVFETNDPQAYNRTIFQGSYSPVLRQWPVALELIHLYKSNDTWQAAGQSLEKMTAVIAGSPALNGQNLLQAEFYRRNTLDFWWLHPRLYDPSYPVFRGLLLWIGLAVLSIVVFWRCNVRAE